MEADWIDKVLRPQLADLDTREWKAESLRNFVVDVHEQITTAARDGALSRDDVGEARKLVAEAMRTIPGITVVEHSSAFGNMTVRALRLPERVARVLETAELLAARHPSIAAIGLAGSWARGRGRPDSDIDLIVLTDSPAELLDDDDWIGVFDVHASLISKRDFGAIQERRLRLSDGLQVDVGVGRPDWASTSPLDEGTAAVVADGLVPIADPDGLLEALLVAAR